MFDPRTISHPEKLDLGRQDAILKPGTVPDKLERMATLPVSHDLNRSGTTSKQDLEKNRRLWTQFGTHFCGYYFYVDWYNNNNYTGT